ncbi:MAG TPA: YraN family protein [Egibacteraceae bacterium]
MDAPHLRLGRLGEAIAVRHLEGAGLEVVARNWRCSDPSLRGEIDLVARDGRVLVVCEVKTRRRAAPGEPLVAVTPRKQRQLRRLAAALVAAGAHTALGTRDLRFDVVAVSWPEGGGAAAVVHLREAF